MKSLTKKKVTLLGVGAMLCLAVAATFGAMSMKKASAATVTNGTGTSTVSYEQADSWSVEIPDTITVGTPVQITASNVNTANGLTITVSSGNSFHLQNDNGADIEYELKVATEQGQVEEAQALTEGGTVLTVAKGAQSGSTYIGAYLKDSSSPATGGAPATDTLTFTIGETAAD